MNIRHVEGPHRRDDQFREAGEVARSRFPIGQRSRLGDPREPTANVPDWRRNQDLAARHELMYPRRLDRGSSGPVNGVRLALQDGSPGGIPRGVRPQLEGAESLPMVPSRDNGKSAARKVRRAVMLARQSNKKALAVTVPGPGGLDFARAPRVKPGSPFGFLGQAPMFLRKKITGQPAFAQESNVPGDYLDKLNADRQAGQASRNDNLVNLYDPPAMSLSEAVKRTPEIVKAIMAGGAGGGANLIPVGQDFGYNFNPQGGGTPTSQARFTGRGSTWATGNPGGSGSDYKPTNQEWGDIVSGRGGNAIASGKIGLGQAVKLTPSIFKARQDRYNELGSLSLGELVRRTPDLVRSDPFLINYNRTGSNFGTRSSAFEGAPGGSLKDEVLNAAGAAYGASIGLPGSGQAGGSAGGGSAATSPIHIGGQGGISPVLVIAAIGAFFLLRR